MSGTPSSRWKTVAAGILVAAAFVALLFRNVDLAAIRQHIAAASAGIVLLSLVTKLVGMMFASLRSYILFRPTHRFTLRSLFASVLTAFVINNIIPLRIGELARVEYLARRGGVSRSSCLAVITLERLLDLIVLVVIFVAVMLAAGLQVHLTAALSLLVGTTMALALALVWMATHPASLTFLVERGFRVLGERVARFGAETVRRFAEGLSSLGSTGAVTAAVASTVGFWISTIAGIHLCIRAFHIALPWHAAVVFLGFISLSTAVSPAPAQIGTYDYFGMLALATFGVTRNLAASITIVIHFMAVVPFTMLGIPVVAAAWTHIRRDLPRE